MPKGEEADDSCKKGVELTKYAPDTRTNTDNRRERDKPKERDLPPARIGPQQPRKGGDYKERVECVMADVRHELRKRVAPRPLIPCRVAHANESCGEGQDNEAKREMEAYDCSGAHTAA